MKELLNKLNDLKREYKRLHNETEHFITQAIIKANERNNGILNGYEIEINESNSVIGIFIPYLDNLNVNKAYEDLKIILGASDFSINDINNKSKIRMQFLFK
jgi:hypothetical protein